MQDKSLPWYWLPGHHTAAQAALSMPPVARMWVQVFKRERRRWEYDGGGGRGYQLPYNDSRRYLIVDCYGGSAEDALQRQKRLQCRNITIVWLPPGSDTVVMLWEGKAHRRAKLFRRRHYAHGKMYRNWMGAPVMTKGGKLAKL